MLHLANRDELLPRFAADKMPAPQAARGGRGGAADAPLTASGHVFVVSTGKPLTVPGSAILGAGGRGGATPISAAVSATPKHGKVAKGTDGGFIYTPAAGFTGSDSFTYKLSRGSDASAEATVTIIVK